MFEGRHFRNPSGEVSGQDWRALGVASASGRARGELVQRGLPFVSISSGEFLITCRFLVLDCLPA